MCRTVHAVLSTAICGIQMLVRVFMTIILMMENVIRMILQTLYNFISFVLQMLSLIPICVVFLLTARLKCFMCGGGGPCPVNRGGACDCIMSALAIIILFFIFRATGVLDKMFYSIGYAKAPPAVPARFVPTPGDITECSRNDTDYTDFTTIQLMEGFTIELTTDEFGNFEHFIDEGIHNIKNNNSGDGQIPYEREQPVLHHGFQTEKNPNLSERPRDNKLNTVPNYGAVDVSTKDDYAKLVPTQNSGYERSTVEITYDPNG